MTRWLAALALMLAAPLLGQSSWPQRWYQATEPARIADNVYFVGTAGLSAFLVTDAKGHVLIDGGLPESAPLIAANVRELGFRIEDVRVLLINHGHFDHAGGLAELKRLSGARLLAAPGDAADLGAGRMASRPEQPRFPAVTVDRMLRDGEVVRVGATRLVTRFTPGHTRGSTSWSLRTMLEGKPVDVLFVSSLSVAGQPLTPAIVAEYRRSFARLRRMKADITLSFHTELFDYEARRTRLAAGERRAFVDRAALGRLLDGAEANFERDRVAQ